MPPRPWPVPALLLLAPPAAQELPGWPEPGADPRGLVIDEAGQPVAGAAVRLVAATDPRRPFARAIAAVLATTPLPRTRTGRDGAFVLPLTNEQRQLESWREPVFWLVVESEGHLPWVEPLGLGLRGYLGSRVVLRADREGDPLRAVPWPQGAVTARLAWSSLPWVPVPERPALPEADARGAAARGATPGQAPVPHELTVRGPGGEPVAARLWFDDSCHVPGAVLPAAVGADGRAALRLPPGGHRVRVGAADCLTKELAFTVAAAGGATEVELEREWLVDLLAVGDDGRPVPFATVDVVHEDFAARRHPSRNVLTDSRGRARVPVGDRPGYFAWQDAGEGEGRRVRFGREGLVRVQMFRPVTLVVRADELPRSGEIVWVRGAERVHRGFGDGDCPDGLVVTTLMTRAHDEIWIGGSRSPPVVVRRGELPPPPPEPLADVVSVERHVRHRADLEVVSSSGAPLRGLRVLPVFQLRSPLLDDSEVHLFSERVDTGRWELWARDGAACELAVEAHGHRRLEFTLPAAAAGARPRLRFELRPE